MLIKVHLRPSNKVVLVQTDRILTVEPSIETGSYINLGTSEGEPVGMVIFETVDDIFELTSNWVYTTMGPYRS